MCALPKDSLEAMATLFFSSRSVRTWKRSSRRGGRAGIRGRSAMTHVQLADALDPAKGT
ncbi:hypothetical protein ACFYYY_29335 [Streptomyces sp. NPDC001834]|uniref:hypothetical protein n=1 Tax=Streptomyces sp. NPDC001834 TaxID=3364616 RepID=UPI0036ADC642